MWSLSEWAGIFDDRARHASGCSGAVWPRLGTQVPTRGLGQAGLHGNPDGKLTDRKILTRADTPDRGGRGDK
ncbi:hypothetical protein FHX69_5479 [Prauserella muralis]|nr:hypothetical protein FHX69_5479 [Prauserella muralis]